MSKTVDNIAWSNQKLKIRWRRITRDGHVYAKFVGSPYEYIEWSIWVPKTLVTNIKGPITKWVPKTKH